jgi:hypothetical protein
MIKSILKWLFPKTYQLVLDEGEANLWQELNPNTGDYTEYPEDWNQYPDELTNEPSAEDILNMSEEEVLDSFMEEGMKNDPIAPCKAGDRIHIKPFQGIYEVVETDYNGFVITCNKWKTQNRPNKRLNWSDFKCHVGQPFKKQL